MLIICSSWAGGWGWERIRKEKCEQGLARLIKFRKKKSKARVCNLDQEHSLEAKKHKMYLIQQMTGQIKVQDLGSGSAILF